MHLSEFNFPFDGSLIATEPVLPREQARLLVLTPRDRSIIHRRIADLPDLLTPGDLLVVNDTRVRPARVKGRKASGRSVDVLFVKAVTDRNWEVLMKGTWRAGQVIGWPRCPVDRPWPGRRPNGGPHRRTPPGDGVVSSAWLHALASIYQAAAHRPGSRMVPTVFAKEEGAIAAPTAGLHLLRCC